MNSALVRLVNIFNSAVVQHLTEALVPYTQLNAKILTLLYQNGYIRGFVNFTPRGANYKKLRILLAYSNKRPILKQLCLISKPSRPVFTTPVALARLANVIGGLKTRTSLVVVLTNQDCLTLVQCLQAGVGGKLLLYGAV